MIDTGGTLAEAVRLVLKNGAASVRLATTHGIFSDRAKERLSELPLGGSWVTNTLPQVRHPNVRCLDIVPLLSAAW